MKSNFKFRILTSAVSIGLVAFVFYALTGARTIQWQDSAQFTYRICSGTMWNEYGLAMVHPLHFWLGRLVMWIFPGPDPWAISLTSALGGALAVGLLFACVFKLTGKTSAALFGALTLMLAHSFWRFSGLPEVYTWSAALLLGEVFCYLQLLKTGRASFWWALFFVNGLAFANHNMALLSTAVWGICFLLWARERGRGTGDGKRETGVGGRGTGGWVENANAEHSTLNIERRREESSEASEDERSSSTVESKRLKPFLQLIPIGFFWLLGALPYLLIILLELKQRAFGEVLHSALFGEGFKDQVTGFLPRPEFLLISLGFMLLSFPGLALPFAGKAVFMERGRAAPAKAASLPLPLLWIGVLHLVFFLRYNVIDQYTFLIPVYALIALMAGVGFSTLKTSVWRRAAWGLLCLQPLFYAAVPPLVRVSGLLTSFERHKPYRDDYEYLFLPWQVQERSAERLAREAFDTLGEAGSLVIGDSMFFYTAAWMREERGVTGSVDLIRPDIINQKPYIWPVVWVPARSDQEPPQGWRKEGEVWTGTRVPPGDE